MLEIKMTRYKRSEIEEAVNEKLRQGWECVGKGIVEVNNERKLWSYGGNGHTRYCYSGRTDQTRYMVKMRRKKPGATP
ncbi:hypothetical protein NDS46_31520 (plasmid) [Paenibacillus thiaminolyticus]|uniref:hypothetical protein n=1 Tax=Paenibacillus thiaminolyticus TaxID=49283 RepID=UPI0023302A4F|nr:hypothetical protein [Paenibacillus thiaminolyticus]WCF11488.1 hypothetical protein NDS46_31520 [Paenibacillus thiaminolyticus]